MNVGAAENELLCAGEVGIANPGPLNVVEVLAEFVVELLAGAAAFTASACVGAASACVGAELPEARGKRAASGTRWVRASKEETPNLYLELGD